MLNKETDQANFRFLDFLETPTARGFIYNIKLPGSRVHAECSRAFQKPKHSLPVCVFPLYSSPR